MHRALFGAALLLAGCASAAPTEDEITNLPGLNFPISFRHFSGYLNSTGGKRLHYWFVESQRDPAKDPLVLWLNGGPGCSSLDGLLYEHGPYLINDDGKTLRSNPHAWNTVANVLYMEAPAGVGFSYSTAGAADYSNNDAQTAQDNLNALVSFFAKFPEYAGREFFVSGESYGGIYVPTLTKAIVDHNKAGAQPKFNIQGFLVGNGLTSYELNDNSLVYFAYNHGLFGDDVWAALQACNGSFYAPPNQRCQDAVNQAMTNIYSVGVNFYGLYEECYPGNAGTKDLRMSRSRNLMFRKARGVEGMPLTQTSKLPLLRMDVPCINSTGATTYLNTPAVQAALHVSPGPAPWSICSDVLHYNSTTQDIRPVWQYLVANGVRGLNYVGDTDAACNFLGNQWAMTSLKLPTTKANRPWYVGQQVAGFVVEYQGFWFATIKGAGHMVPQWRPVEALYFFSRFLDGVSF